MKNEVILEVRNLKTYFNTGYGVVKAVDGVSFDLHKEESLGLVGESGSGKSVTNLSILRLIPSPPGKIVDGEAIFRGKNVLSLSEEEIRSIRGSKISMIFQDPMTSLNPVLTISTQIMETIQLHQKLSKKQSREKAIEMLKMVGIPDPIRRIDDYPHQFSGGMRQRVMIAMALSCNPDILIADEPTSALDVTIQAQIMEIIKNLLLQMHISVIIITHDLGVVAGMCDNICVMYAGRIVEKAAVDDLFNDPQHPYTRGLIDSVPRFDRPDMNRLHSIQGQPPSLIDMPAGCPFQPRCEQAMPVCREKYPDTFHFGHERTVCCWLCQKDK